MPRPRNEEELEALIRQRGPVSRTSARRVFGGRASEAGGEVFSKDHLEFQGDDGSLESLDLIVSRTCDFGHLVGSDGVEIVGRCGCCGKLVCSARGCAYTADRGRVVCAKHRVEMGDRVHALGDVPGVVLRAVLLFPLRLVGSYVKAAAQNYGLDPRRRE